MRYWRSFSDVLHSDRMRWRTKGTVAYTDGIKRPWQVTASLLTLLIQVNETYPVSHTSDGTVAGQGHYLNSPKSDHTPDKNGWVRAADIGEVIEDDAFDIAESIRLSRDPRIKYAIHEDRIYSSYNHPNGAMFTWRPYYGSNSHRNHVHFSMMHLNQGDTRPWDIGEGGEDMVTRKDKADNGLFSLAINFQELKDAGVFSDATQPGGITFNDEFATFLLRFEDYIVRKYALGHDHAAVTGVGPHRHLFGGTVGQPTT